MKPSRLAVPALLCSLALITAPVAAGEIRLGYTAIGRLMEERLFTDDGRRFLQGSSDSECAYTYVEQPAVNGVAGRLYIRMKVTTRLGVEVSGSCLGTSDTFFASVSGTPVYADGVLELAEVEVETEGRGYGEALGPLLAEVTRQALRYPLRRKIVESSELVLAETGLDLRVPKLEIPEIRLERRQMVVPFDFRLVLE